ncbi:restriction endonuclease subunit S [Pseudomonas fulva]|uniref:restriction endonuclease subunit S n=1 Tax=Pseudomonas fulva TaxID=47880 RepID=UPI0018ABB4CD|nr:restriction endonuclease subunit S [Pseudomonas fulva]MBF8777431.1 restriction endonuclease subunit S [Pseudomonas fulva]
MSELPSGWAHAEIGDLCSLINGRAFKPQEWADSGLPIIRIQNLNNPKAMFNHYSGTLDGKHHVSNGDLLFAWSGTPGTSFGAHIWHGGDAALNQHIFKIEFSALEIDRDFLRYAINQKLDELIGLAQGGVGLRHVTKGTFEKTKIAFPPRAEQARIAAKLGELLAQVDTVKARIDGIPALIKRFRQSVLAAAVSGHLTEDWRMRDVEFISEDKRPGWIPKSLPELGELARGKSKHRPRNDERLFGGEYPFIQTGEVANSSGRIKTAKVFYSDFGLAQSRLFPKGTLCITIAANIADTAILDIESCFPDSIVGFIANEDKCCAQFVKYLIDANKQNLEDFAPATAQKNINLKALSELVFPMPSLAEQIEIVRRVEQTFAFADQLNARIKAAQLRINLLTQSVLARAFRGELAPQNPTDEPAGVLLERIKTRRAAAPKVKRGRRAVTLG